MLVSQQFLTWVPVVSLTTLTTRVKLDTKDYKVKARQPRQASYVFIHLLRFMYVGKKAATFHSPPKIHTKVVDLSNEKVFLLR